jgi:lipopolysaccharide/colanic/teichoic acid biosynthesis glycosyltransferase
VGGITIAAQLIVEITRPETGSIRIAESRSKRVFDVVVAATALVLLSPLLLAIAAAVVIDSGWPPLYSQMRTGLEGRPFRIWKFRTMVRNAELQRAELLAFNEAPFPTFKMRNDPRITRVGRFLRKSSADELPQLWNVLVGEMSLVGPRPLYTPEADALDATGRLRLRVRPGITCLWQLSNRHSRPSSFEDWLAKDLAYMESWSLWRDVVLLAQTVGAVIRMTGR